MVLGPGDLAARVSKARPTCLEPIGSGKSGALLGTWRDGTKAVVKLARESLPNGKLAQRGIPASQHPRREMAFFNLAQALGWGDLAPEVALFKLGGCEASAQAFIPASQLVNFDDGLKDVSKKKCWIRGLKRASRLAPKDQWIRLTLLDVVAGSRDRHANNVGLRTLVRPAGLEHRIVAWDNAVTFGDAFRLYHNVFHKFLFRHVINVDPAWAAFSALSRVALDDALMGLVPPDMIEHAWLRHRFVVEYPYKLPWKALSDGFDRPSNFPTHESFFREGLESDLGDTRSDLVYLDNQAA